MERWASPARTLSSPGTSPQAAYHGVDLAGLSVVAVIGSSETLGFSGLEGGREMKSILVVDQRAGIAQREALIQLRVHRLVARVNRWFALSLNRLP